MNNELNCRFCGGSLAELVDLGMSPLCESYLAKEQLNSMEPFYPLAAYICRDCLLARARHILGAARTVPAFVEMQRWIGFDPVGAIQLLQIAEDAGGV